MIDQAALPSAWPRNLRRVLHRRARDRAVERGDQLDPGAISDWIRATRVDDHAGRPSYVAVTGSPFLDAAALADVAAVRQLGYDVVLVADPAGRIEVSFTHTYRRTT